MQMHATKHAMKQSLKLVEASIKAKGQLYCYLSITWLLIKKALGSKRPWLLQASIM